MKNLSLLSRILIISCCCVLVLAQCNRGSKLKINIPASTDSKLASTIDSSNIEDEYQGSESQYYDDSKYSESKISMRQIEIPYNIENGVKYVRVKVNGIGLDMIFDTGCSGTYISIAEANYLYQKGLLTENDILGSSYSQVADGRITENMVINLKEVVLDDQISFSDVQATAADNVRAPLLLGNEVLDRVSSVKINNENQTIIFEVRIVEDF